MRFPTLLRGALVALTALFCIGLQSANADSGRITLTIYKGGWIIGGSAGGRGVRAIVLTNQNGAILELSGRQVGLMANADPVSYTHLTLPTILLV